MSRDVLADGAPSDVTEAEKRAICRDELWKYLGREPSEDEVAENYAAAERTRQEEAQPVAHCPKCGAPWFHTEGFCGGCRP